MNLNILAYIIYFAITVFIILKIGKICFTNGNIFVAQLLPNHEVLCLKINQLLLVGYYLLNLGYCAITLISWEKIQLFSQFIEAIAFKSGGIILTIAFFHYINIILITLFIKKLI